MKLWAATVAHSVEHELLGPIWETTCLDVRRPLLAAVAQEPILETCYAVLLEVPLRLPARGRLVQFHRPKLRWLNVWRR